MWRQSGRFGCLLFILLTGCQGLFGPHGLPADPFFANRKPVESRAKTGPPEPTPSSEPIPPVNHYITDQRPTKPSVDN
jgi:hypothetical protein